MSSTPVTIISTPGSINILSKYYLIFWYQLDVIFYVPKCLKDHALLFRKILELN